MSDELVGRAPELGLLTAAIEAAVDGRGSVVLVSGEPGIGKTRLCEEAVRLSRLDSRWAVCWEDEAAPAYWPWSQVLRSDDSIDITDLATKRAANEIDPEQSRFGLFDAVSSALRRAAEVTPLLIVIDDLHWADLPSLSLLQFVAHEIRDARLCVIGTYRDAELARTGERSRMLAEISARARGVALRGLDETHVGALLAAVSGALTEGDVVARVHERTGGNPLFVRELGRLMVARGSTDAAIPDSVRGVLERRLARLSQETHQFLTAAAVSGAEFRVDLVSKMTGTDPQRGLELLDEALAAQLVAGAGSVAGHFSFSHALVRDVLYESIPLSRRVVLHSAAGGAIEAAAPTDGHLAELAHHYLQAAAVGGAEKAIDYAARAGRWALERAGYEEATAHFGRALEVLHLAPDERRRLDLLLLLGDAKLRSGDVQGAREAFRTAANLAAESGDAQGVARAALGMGAGLSGFEIRLAEQHQVDLLEEALRALGEEDSSLRAWVLARLSVALTIGESIQRRVELAERAVAMARRVGDRRALAYALSAHCDAIAGPDDSERRAAEAAEIVRLAADHGDRPLEMLGRRLLVVAHLEMGDMLAATSEMEAFGRLAEVLRQPLYAWYVPLWKGLRGQVSGRLAEALACADEVEAIGARANSVNASMLAAVLRWMTLVAWGRADEAYRAAQQLWDHVGEFGRIYIDFFDGWMLPMLGRTDEAAPLVDRVAKYAVSELRVDAEWLATTCQAAEGVFPTRNERAAAELYDVLRPYRHRIGVEGIGAGLHGSVELHLGLLARTLGRTDLAIEHFEAARTTNGRLGARLLVARSAKQLAAVLRERGEASDLRRAAELEAEAAGIAAAAGLEERASPAAASFRREGEYWTLTFDGATVRMKDVKGLGDIARLIGASGREIAALDLAGGVAPSAARSAVEGLGPEGHAGEVLDAEARTAYKARLAELEEDIDVAEAMGDGVRAERARGERDAIARELASAYGLGGRARKAGDPAERARSAVTWRIRDALKRIEQAHPSLGRHQRHSVRTGTFCSYEPEQPIAWEL